MHFITHTSCVITISLYDHCTLPCFLLQRGPRLAEGELLEKIRAIALGDELADDCVRRHGRAIYSRTCISLRISWIYTDYSDSFCLTRCLQKMLANGDIVHQAYICSSCVLFELELFISPFAFPVSRSPSVCRTTRSPSSPAAGTSSAKSASWPCWRPRSRSITRAPARFAGRRWIRRRTW